MQTCKQIQKRRQDVTIMLPGPAPHLYQGMSDLLERGVQNAMETEARSPAQVFRNLNGHNPLPLTGGSNELTLV